jgi:hypothetical protein
MSRKLRYWPSPAMVIGGVALAIALGGTSYAAVTALPSNSVGTKQLKRNAVIGSKVKNDSLTGADVLESSLAKVPTAANADNAAHASSADNATAATTATNATNATTATNATHAGNADQLAGVAAAGYQRSTLTSGQTERGDYSAWGVAGGYLGAFATFPIPLTAGLDSSHVHFIASGGTPPAECPGTHNSPEAASGHLCVYETSHGNSALGRIDSTSNGLGPATDRYGFGIYFTTSGSGGAWSYGTWAVTG